MSEPKPTFSEYFAPAALYIGGLALTGFATGGATFALGAGAAVGGFLSNLAPGIIGSIMERNRSARAAAREFALNDVLARTFGRAAGRIADAVAEEAKKEGDKKAAKALQSLVDGFEELWVERMHHARYGELETMDGQDLAKVFSEALVERKGMPVSETTWRGILKRKGMPIADRWGAFQIEDRWIDALTERLTSDEFSQAFAHELAHKPEASAKMTLRMLAEWRETATASEFSDEEKRGIVAAAEGMPSEFEKISRQVEGLEERLLKEIRDLGKQMKNETEDIKNHINQKVTPSLHPFELPPAAARGFVGREAELTMQRERLAEGRNTYVVAPAGLGKTALAAQALNDVVPDFDSLPSSPFPHGVVYLDLYQFRGNLDLAWSAIANSLKGTDFLKEQGEKSRAREACRGLSFLLIVEGAEEADGLEGRGSLGDLLSVLTSQNRWLVLTRNLDQSEPADRIEIRHQFTPAESETLFDRLLGERPADETIKRRVLPLLDGHPLAITWAAGLLAHGIEEPDELADAWEASELPALHDPRKEQAHHTLHWLFQRSTRSLTAEQGRVLAACGLLARAPFPREIIEAVLPDSRPALAELAGRSLLRRADRKGHWEFTHALGYRFARALHHEPDVDMLLALGAWIGESSRTALAVERGLDGLGEAESTIIHAGAVLALDPKARLWSALANPLLYDFRDRFLALGRLDLVAASLETVRRWLDGLQVEATEAFHLERERSSCFSKLGDLAV
ncbi:MAG: hypothetical protein KDN19_03110, partial [Verrucomicrobiae bacterium]|nr:hypothetical protein [Verrucomicrobiae bacterium]